MKKIKKINSVKLSISQMKKVVGEGGGPFCSVGGFGINDEGCNYSTLINMGAPGSGNRGEGGGESGGGNSGPPSDCGCACGNCSMDTFGMGASIGFARTK